MCGELADAARKLLDQKFAVMVWQMDGRGTYRDITSVQELKPGDKHYNIGVRSTDTVAALDGPATLAALRAMPEAIDGQTVNGFGIVGGSITADHVRALRVMPLGKNLQFLSWTDAMCSDEAVAELKGFKRLVLITLARMRGLSPKSIESIAVSFPELYRIMLSQLDCDPSFLAYLRPVKLRWLEIWRMPQIDDGCVESLAEIQSLTRLTTKGCQVTAEGVKRLTVALPACRIEWDGGVYPTPAPPPK